MKTLQSVTRALRTNLSVSSMYGIDAHYAKFVGSTFIRHHLTYIYHIIINGGGYINNKLMYSIVRYINYALRLLPLGTLAFYIFTAFSYTKGNFPDLKTEGE